MSTALNALRHQFALIGHFGKLPLALFLIGLVVVWSTTFLYLQQRSENQRNNFLSSLSAQHQIAWQATLQSHSTTMESWYNEELSDNEVLTLMRLAQQPAERDQARQRLHQLLHSVYDQMAQRGIIQLHFHLPGGESLLRFYDSERHGDNLMSSRKMVRYANAALKPASGFEDGVTTSGFRHIWPIFDQNHQHLGSVEMVITFEQVADEMIELLKSVALRGEAAPDHELRMAKVVDPEQVTWLKSIKKDAVPFGESGSSSTIINRRLYTLTHTSIYNTDGNHFGYILGTMLSPQLEEIAHSTKFTLVAATLLLAIIAAALWLLLVNRHQHFEARQQLQAIYKAMEEGLYVMDSKGIITHLNESATSMLGYSAQELIGKVAHNLFHTHCFNDHLSLEECSIFITTSHIKGSYSGQEIFRRKDGSHFTARVNSRPLLIGKVLIGSVTTFRDISKELLIQEEVRQLNEQLLERVEAEVKLKLLNEAKYHTLFDYVPDAIFVYSIDEDGMPGNFSEANDAACMLLQLERDEIKQMSPADLNKERSHEQLREMMDDLIQSGLIISEESISGPLGEQRRLVSSARHMRIGEELLVITLLHDVTELRRLQEERELQQATLIQQSKMAELGAMIDAIAHQWKQPLNTVSLIAQDLPDAFIYGELDEEMIQKRTEDILEQVRFMSQTVEDFRDFYKPSRKRELFAIDTAIEKVLLLLKGQFNSRGIEVTIECNCHHTEHPKPSVSGFSGEFKQVILNLLNNSKEAFIERSIKTPKITITIESLPERHEVVTTLCDNGGGIPGDLLPDRLFEPFISTKLESGGSGIGLSLARKIINEKMDGKIIAANSTDGACFTITLPLPDITENG